MAGTNQTVSSSPYSSHLKVSLYCLTVRAMPGAQRFSIQGNSLSHKQPQAGGVGPSLPLRLVPVCKDWGHRGPAVARVLPMPCLP